MFSLCVPQTLKLHTLCLFFWISLQVPNFPGNLPTPQGHEECQTNQIQIFVTEGGFNNARGKVYVMGLILLLACLQFYSRLSEHLTVSVSFAIICLSCVL